MSSKTLQELIKDKTSFTAKLWLDGNKRRQFVGTITFGQQVTLEISGTNQIDLTKHKYDEVCGRGSDGEFFILRDCYVDSSSSKQPSGRWSLTLTPTDVVAFTSTIRTDNPTTTVTHFEAKIPYLDFWLDHQLFSTSFTDHAIKFEDYKSEEVELGEAKLVLNTSLMGIAGWHHNTRNQMDIKQYSVLRFEYPKEVEYTQALRLYRKIESFFRIAYASPFYVREFGGSFLRYGRQNGHKIAKPELKEIYLNRFVDRTIERSPSIIDQLFLFKFKDIENFGVTISRWLEIEEPLQPVYQLLLISLESGVYLEQRFISLTNALEIFHRRFRDRTRKPEAEWLLRQEDIVDKLTGEDRKLVKGLLKSANQLTLEERIVDLVGAVNNTGFQGMMPNTIKEIAKVRNAFVHEDFGGKHNLDLVEVNDALTELLLINILLEMNFTKEEIHPMTRNSDIFRYSSGLRIK